MSHPERTCVGCRAKRPKAELVRIIRIPDSPGVQIDERQRRPGRGAYLCPRLSCWQAGTAGGRLDRTLRTNVPAAARQELLRAFTMGVK